MTETAMISSTDRLGWENEKNYFYRLIMNKTNNFGLPKKDVKNFLDPSPQWEGQTIWQFMMFVL